MEAIAWPALRAFLSMLVPMVALLAAGRLDLVAGAVFGALTSVYCRSEPYRQQARTLAAVAVTMVVSVAIGDLIAVHGPSGPWQEALSLLATALVGAITTAAATAVKLGPPGGLIFAFATGACSHLPLSHADLPLHLLVTALSAALAWGVSIAGAVVIGLGPQRRAVAAALEATAAHVEARLDPTARHRAAVAVETAWNSVANVGRLHRDSPDHLALVQATQLCENLLFSGEADPAALRRAATAARSGTAFGELLGDVAAEAATPPPPASRWRLIRGVLVAALRPGQHASSWLVPYAFRVVVAALLGSLLTHLLGIGHAYWAAVSAVSVMQATSTSTSVPRMLQRVTGTIGGVLVCLGLLTADPPAWAIILLLAALQWGAELTVLMNYAFGLFFATPVALLVSAFNSSAPPAEIASDRLWATLLGAAVAVAVNWVSPTRAWVARVRTAMDRVHQLTATEPVPRAELRKALIELHEAYDVASGEVRSSKLPTEQLLELSHRAHAVLEEAGQRSSADAAPRQG